MRQNQIFFKGVFLKFIVFSREFSVDHSGFCNGFSCAHNEKPSPPEGSEGHFYLQAFPLNKRDYLLKCTEEVRPLASYSGVTL